MKNHLLLALLVALALVACSDDGGPEIVELTAAPVTGTPVVSAPSPLDATLTPPATIAAEGLQPARVVRVIDGDTIEVEIDGAEYTVRYIGVDTPETVHPSQPVGCFGPEASNYNEQLVEGETVALEKDVSETDQFGRLLRYVWTGQNAAQGEGQTMVNAVLVLNGYAQVVTFPPDVKYQDLFLDYQREAREAGRGLWGEVCAGTPNPTPLAGGCEFSSEGGPVIKGNISQSSGERIYHVPGQQYYEQTVIDESAGERWFCTENEAIEAGWRKSKV